MTEWQRNRRIKTRKPVGFRSLQPDGWTREQRWLRMVLDFYVQCSEIMEPGGTDSFGRVKDLAKGEAREINFRMRPGAVWITKDLFRVCWVEEFDQVHHHAEEKNIAQASMQPESRDANFGIRHDSMKNLHPVDSALRTMLKKGLIIRHKQDQYWFSPTFLKVLDKLDVLDVHQRRMLEHERNPLRYRNPNHSRWSGVLKALRDCVVFDKEVVRRYALDAGLDDVTDSAISTHLHSWQNPGPRQKKEVDRIALGLYRTTRSNHLNKSGEPDGHRPEMPMLTDWLWQFVAVWAPYQRKVPEATFTWEDVVDNLSDEWYQHASGDLTKERIQERLARFCYVSRRGKEDAIVERGFVRGTYRVVKRIMKAFDDKKPSIAFKDRLYDALLEEFSFECTRHDPFWFILPDIRAALPDYEYGVIHQALRKLQDDGMIVFDGYLLPHLDIEMYRHGKTPPDLAVHEMYVMTKKVYEKFGLHSTFQEPYSIPRDQDGFPIRERVRWQAAIQPVMDAARKRFTLEIAR